MYGRPVNGHVQHSSHHLYGLRLPGEIGSCYLVPVDPDFPKTDMPTEVSLSEQLSYDGPGFFHGVTP